MFSVDTLHFSHDRKALPSVRALTALLARLAVTLIVFSAALVLFWMAIAVVAYRLPALQPRQIIEGIVQCKKIEMGQRNMFEELFANRNIVRLEDTIELYIPINGNERIWAGNGRYRLTVSARPLLFGGFADAEVLTLVRIEAMPLERSQEH